MDYTFPVRVYAVIGILLLSCVGCRDSSGVLFEPLPARHTGVDFVNVIPQNDSLLNALDVNYLFSEGGVAAGDLNDDGRTDLYFTGHLAQNELYLNQGDLQFRKVTEAAGIGADGAWSTGIALVDVNQDGLLDIYLCVGGPAGERESRANRLYVNQGIDDEGIPRFEDRAEDYGVAEEAYSIQAAFFDYDRDNDLDLYVLNTGTQAESQMSIRRTPTEGPTATTDRLYRNNGDGTFTDVSESAGITLQGHGLGLAISDINKDGWPDVYAANDFISNDLLYVNNGDGTFTNRVGEYLKHQSYSSMGVDVADVNNDTWNDILVLDMRPPGNRRNQLMSRFFDEASFQQALRSGYEPQYVRNMLQFNRGPRPGGGLAFSEIGQLVGIEATDWSWAPLLADFDNDGDRDLFVSNGYGKDMTNLDFLQEYERIMTFGSEADNRQELSKAVEALPRVELRNYFFENEGTLSFVNRTGEWAISPPGISTGATMADLDQDGDLDLVTNNVNEEATILENHASARDSANALRVHLHGPPGNRSGFGAKLTLYGDRSTQYYEHSPYRGFKATVEPIAHFGLGADSTADSLEVVWPDGKTQVLNDVPAGPALTLQYADASTPRRSEASTASMGGPDSLLFREVSAERGLLYRHEERTLNAFRRTPILPHELSQEGPGLAVGDIDGNGLDDVFVGADRRDRSVLFHQVESGRFRRDTLGGGSKFEDRGALFFDAEGDGDQDLYVVSGGPVRTVRSSFYQDRLYLNDGSGTLRRAPEALPTIKASGSVVTAADYDADGDLDLFVGGRVRPGDYPLPPRSYLLRNDSNGRQVRFTDVTDEVAPDLAEVGLVTDALWTDYNDDGQIDLMVVGEWMPITVFEKGEGGFTEVTEAVGLGNTSGWWMSLAAGDFDRDGDTDYVAGNLGLNTKYEASPDQPLRVHAKDYDQNGQLDPVLTHYVNGTSYPVPRRDEMVSQIPRLKGRFPTYARYAEASFAELFPEKERKDAYVREAVYLKSSVLENTDTGTLDLRALPRQMQLAPVFGMDVGDYNGDGHLDLLAVGNWYAPDVHTGRADAFTGAFLRGDGKGHFTVQDGTESGFFVEGDGKGLARVAGVGGESLMLATQNNGSLKAFRYRGGDASRTIQLQPLDESATLVFENGDERRAEFYYGSTYLSQSSRVLYLPKQVKKVVISNSRGEQRTLTVAEGPVVDAK